MAMSLHGDGNGNVVISEGGRVLARAKTLEELAKTEVGRQMLADEPVPQIGSVDEGDESDLVRLFTTEF